jgi:hypothetical protein
MLSPPIGDAEAGGGDIRRYDDIGCRIPSRLLKGAGFEFADPRVDSIRKGQCASASMTSGAFTLDGQEMRRALQTSKLWIIIRRRP